LHIGRTPGRTEKLRSHKSLVETWDPRIGIRNFWSFVAQFSGRFRFWSRTCNSPAGHAGASAFRRVGEVPE